MSVKATFEEYSLYDVAILSHCFAPHMRDYDILIEAMWGVHEWGDARGRYLCRFTHCPEAHLLTDLSDEGWRKSWADTFIDYAAWERDNAPEGFVWGVCWSNAYPGFKYVDNSKLAAKWTERFERDMHETFIETEVFTLQLIFHDFIINKVSDDLGVVEKTMIPLTSK